MQADGAPPVPTRFGVSPSATNSFALASSLSPSAMGFSTQRAYSRHVLSPEGRVALGAAVEVLQDEVRNAPTLISARSLEHIHAGEVLMTVGASPSVEAFVLSAAKKRRFSVYCVEAAPSFEGHNTALKLAGANIETTVISDAAVFALMARVNTVILSADAVLANGGIIGVAGSEGVAQAASHHSVPVVVLAELYKVTPVYPSVSDGLRELGPPSAVMPFAGSRKLSGPGLEVLNPLTSYVPPELVSLFITNQEGYVPSYIYRLLHELTVPGDEDFAAALKSAA